MRRVLLLVVLVGLAGGAAYLAPARPDAGPAAPQNVAVVTRGTLEETVEITGTIASGSVHNLTFATAGTVSVVDAGLGDQVSQNQVIARLDTSALGRQLAAARIGLEAANKSLAAAKSSLTSAQSTLDATEEEQPTAPPGIPGPLPTTELQHDAAIDAAKAAVANAEAAVANAEAAIASTEATIAASEKAIEGAEIRSPVAGRITRMLLKVDDRVAPGALTAAVSPVQVMDLDNLRIEAQASEDDVVNLALDQRARITFDALDDITLDGHVCEIESVGILIQGVPTFPVRI